ncbi:MAG: hypothetical protein H6843_06815 [Rhodospirillaceae bacterium]|nr:hypothetical protein [Rhodospirillaceae bacterium]
MARRIHKRYRVTGTLVAQTPLHVGGTGARLETDLPLAVDGAGRHYIPGTSLAGALRGWHRQACRGAHWDAQFTGEVGGKAAFCDRLWGFQLSGKDKGGIASHVLIEDAPVATPLPPEIRHGVGIDRVEGRAADRIKYDRQILPRGTCFDLDMTIEVPDSCADSGVRAALGHLLTALKHGDVRLGASKTRGLGRIKLNDGSVFEETLGSRDGIVSVLKARANQRPANSGKALFDTLCTVDATKLATVACPKLTISIAWEPAGPVMVKSDVEGISVDMLPLVSGAGETLAPVIPGSSIKGALRAQAERIAATVLDICLDKDIPGRERFLTHVARVDLVETLFGAPGPEEKPKKKQDIGPPRAPKAAGPVLGLGAVAVDDCFAEQHIKPDAWQGLLDAEAGDTKSQAPLLSALQNADLSGFYPATHVAIDRWTGGAADSFLYSVLEPGGLAWEPISIELDLTRLAVLREREDVNAARETPTDGNGASHLGRRQAAIALFLLTLRDLLFERIPIGFGSNRGLGAVKVTSIKITSPEEDADGWLGGDFLVGLSRTELTAEKFRKSDPELCKALAPMEKVWGEFLKTEGKA